MSSPKVSIVMTAYKRAWQLHNTLESIYSQSFKDFEVLVVEDGDDGGATEAVCTKYPVRYFQRKRRPGVLYSNPAVPVNIGIKRAEGEVTILQNAECAHTSQNMIEEMSKCEYDQAIFASVLNFDKQGKPLSWYCHPIVRREPWFFCGAVHTSHLQFMRGVDEDFTGYGMDDVDLADRLKALNIRFTWRGDLHAMHQWHESYHGQIDYSINKNIYDLKAKNFTVRRNPDTWGEIE